MSDRLLTREELLEKGMNIDGQWDLDAITLCQDAKTRELTLKEVGEWLGNNYSITYGRAPLKLTHYGFTSVFWNKLIEALKRGEMPE
jgi:hypothetical protein